jgi:hypothetical protein
VSAKIFSLPYLFLSDEDVVTVIYFARDSQMSRTSLYFFLELLKRFGVVKIDINFYEWILSIDDDESSQVPPLHGRKGSGSLSEEYSSSRNSVSDSPPRLILLSFESARCNRYSARHCRFASLEDLEGPLLGSWLFLSLRMHRFPVVPGRGASDADITFADELSRYPEISDS